jgi:PPM family protein phosphatase
MTPGVSLVLKMIKRLFSGKSEGGNKLEDKTVPLAKDHHSSPSQSVASTRYQIASCQSPGKERFNNEDTLFTFSSELFGVDAPIFFGIFLVADGMGGHQSGEVASKLAAQAAAKELLDRLFEPLIVKGDKKKDTEFINLVESAVKRGQALIHQQVPGGGTTLTLALAVGEKIYLAHVGDSRLYLIDKTGQLELKTQDHTLVKRLVDLGEITPQEASTHPQRNVLYRALGQEDPLAPDLDQFSLEVRQRMMICSDGLWGVLEEDQLENIFKREGSLEKAACELVAAANEAGGPDNISVILVERLS